MRETFPGDFPLTPTQQEELWADAIIVLDANTLLNAYRYSLPAREDFIHALQSVAGRIWIPHQVAHEFFRNRVEVIRQQRGIPRSYRDALEALAGHVASQIGQFARNSLVEIDPDRNRIVEVIRSIQEATTQREEGLLNRYGVTPQADPILELFGEIFAGKIGQPIEATELELLYKSGAIRYENKVPPGYKDASKPAPSKYGDLVVWCQILEHASALQSNVLFVTDDAKEDWWWMAGGEVLGPRTELRSEFALRTNGRVYYSFRPEKFMRELASRRLVTPQRGVVEEIKDTSDRLALSARSARNFRITLGQADLLASNVPARRVRELVQNARHGGAPVAREILVLLGEQAIEARSRLQLIRADIATSVDQHNAISEEIDSSSAVTKEMMDSKAELDTRISALTNERRRIKHLLSTIDSAAEEVTPFVVESARSDETALGDLDSEED